LIELLGQSPALWAAMAGVIGLLVGSFINVVIHRLPNMMELEWQRHCAELEGTETTDKTAYNLFLPRSSCPACGHAIAWHENIPVLSWLRLRGRCSACSAPISARYPMVEVLGSATAAWAAWHFGFGWQSAAAIVFLWALLALAFIDLDTYLLPDSLTLPLLWLGLVFNLNGGFVSLDSAVIGAVAGYLSLWLVYHLFRLLTGKEGMGFGDFKLLAALGAWFGWAMLPLIILLSSLVGAVIGIAMIFLAGRDRAKPIPFGPYLVLAGVIALFWGKPLMSLYLGQ
jgi:leader peptidase (prepilin peptidase)/N-methyltransferase